MDGLLWVLGILAVILLVCMGNVLDVERYDCKNGAPRIIDHKVYRCVESK